MRQRETAEMTKTVEAVKTGEPRPLAACKADKLHNVFELAMARQVPLCILYRNPIRPPHCRSVLRSDKFH